MGRPKVSLKEKVEKKFPDFAQEVAGLSVSDLEKRLSNYAKASSENDEKEQQDEDLEKAKEEVADMKSIYSEPRKELKMKTGYMVGLIKEKGGQ